MVKITLDLISKSPKHLNSVKEYQLTLRGNKIMEIENLVITKDQFCCIDMTDNIILKLSCLPKLQRLRTLFLMNNKISMIEVNYAENCKFLENLILTNNQISKIEEIDNIATCKSLIRLSLVDNMITHIKNYRLYTIWKIPTLRVLDFQKVKKSEREEAKALFKGKQVQNILNCNTDEKYLKLFENQIKTNHKKQIMIDTIMSCNKLEELESLEKRIRENDNLLNKKRENN